MASAAAAAAAVFALCMLACTAATPRALIETCERQCIDQCSALDADAAAISDARYLSTFLRSLHNKYVGQRVTLLVPDFQLGFMEGALRDFCLVAGCEPSFQVTNNANWWDDVNQDLRSARLCDGYSLMGAWMPDFASVGLLEKLTAKVQSQPVLNWLDVYPSNRDSTLYKGDVYMIPLDGDVIEAIYRLDLLESENMTRPRTLAELADASAFFHGRDLNGDGEPDFGICFSSAGNDIGGELFWAAMAPFLQTQGTAEGVFFNPDSMNPRMEEEPVFRDAMRLYKRLVLASPFALHGPTTWLQNNAYFDARRCAFYFNYPGPVKMVIAGQAANGLGGALEVLKLPGVACAECPHAVDGVNYAPFYAGGGGNGAIRATAEEAKKSAIFDFFSWLSDPEIGYLVVANPGTLLDPMRASHVAGLDNATSRVSRAFMEQGWEERQLLPLKELVEDVFSSPNAAFDLRLPGSAEYTKLQTMPHLISYWAGEQDLDRTVADMVAAWGGITSKYGLANQRKQYREGLGLGPYIPPAPDAREDGETLRIVLVTSFIVIGALAVLGLASLVIRRIHHAFRAERQQRRASENAARQHFADLTRLNCNMALISRADFEKAGQFVPFETVRDSGMHVNLDTYEDARRFCAENHVVFVSHQWLGLESPDPHRVQFEATCAALTALTQEHSLHYGRTYIWLDYTSIPQRNKMLLHMAIDSIQVYATLPKYFMCMVVDAEHESGHNCGPQSYLDRGWCRLEQWARISVGGLDGVYTWSSARGLCPLSSQGQFVEGLEENWFETSIRVCDGSFTDKEDKHRLKGVITALWMFAVLTREENDVVYRTVQEHKQAVFPREIFGSKAIEIAEKVCEELAATGWRQQFDIQNAMMERMPSKYEI